MEILNNTNHGKGRWQSCENDNVKRTKTSSGKLNFKLFFFSEIYVFASTVKVQI